jgi:Ca2+-binding RTX toxin-like protein
MSARLPRIAIGSLVTLIAVSVISAAAAANTVPPTYAGQSDTPISITDLVPPQCGAITLVRVQIGAGGNGGGNVLVLGTGASETLTGGGGDDCIFGGVNSHDLRGQGGNDVLISPPGVTATLNGSGGYDICYGDPVLTTRIGCEEFYPNP